MKTVVSCQWSVSSASIRAKDQSSSPLAISLALIGIAATSELPTLRKVTAGISKQWALTEQPFRSHRRVTLVTERL